MCPTETHSKNFALAVNAAARAAGKIVTTSFPPLQFAKQNAKQNLDPVEFHIDFVTMFRPSEFSEFLRRSEIGRIGLMEVAVLSLEDMIKLKQRAFDSGQNRYLNYLGSAALIESNFSLLQN